LQNKKVSTYSLNNDQCSEIINKGFCEMRMEKLHNTIIFFFLQKKPKILIEMPYICVFQKRTLSHSWETMKILLIY